MAKQPMNFMGMYPPYDWVDMAKNTGYVPRTNSRTQNMGAPENVGPQPRPKQPSAQPYQTPRSDGIASPNRSTVYDDINDTDYIRQKAETFEANNKAAPKGKPMRDTSLKFDKMGNVIHPGPAPLNGKQKIYRRALRYPLAIAGGALVGRQMFNNEDGLDMYDAGAGALAGGGVIAGKKYLDNNYIGGSKQAAKNVGYNLYDRFMAAAPNGLATGARASWNGTAYQQQKAADIEAGRRRETPRQFRGEDKWNKAGDAMAAGTKTTPGSATAGLTKDNPVARNVKIDSLIEQGFYDKPTVVGIRAQQAAITEAEAMQRAFKQGTPAYDKATARVKELNTELNRVIANPKGTARQAVFDKARPAGEKAKAFMNGDPIGDTTKYVQDQVDKLKDTVATGSKKASKAAQIELDNMKTAMKDTGIDFSQADVAKEPRFKKTKAFGKGLTILEALRLGTQATANLSRDNYGVGDLWDDAGDLATGLKKSAQDTYGKYDKEDGFAWGDAATDTLRGTPGFIGDVAQSVGNAIPDIASNLYNTGANLNRGDSFGEAEYKGPEDSMFGRWNPNNYGLTEYGANDLGPGEAGGFLRDNDLARLTGQRPDSTGGLNTDPSTLERVMKKKYDDMIGAANRKALVNNDEYGTPETRDGYRWLTDNVSKDGIRTRNYTGLTDSEIMQNQSQQLRDRNFDDPSYPQDISALPEEMQRKYMPMVNGGAPLRLDPFDPNNPATMEYEARMANEEGSVSPVGDTMTQEQIDASSNMDYGMDVEYPEYQDNLAAPTPAPAPQKVIPPGVTETPKQTVFKGNFNKKFNKYDSLMEEGINDFSMNRDGSIMGNRDNGTLGAVYDKQAVADLGANPTLDARTAQYDRALQNNPDYINANANMLEAQTKARAGSTTDPLSYKERLANQKAADEGPESAAKVLAQTMHMAPKGTPRFNEARQEGRRMLSSVFDDSLSWLSDPADKVSMTEATLARLRNPQDGEVKYDVNSGKLSVLDDNGWIWDDFDVTLPSAYRELAGYAYGDY